MSENLTDAQVDAAIEVISEEIDLGGTTRVTDFIAGPDDPPAGPERDAALARLREADAAAYQHVRDLVRRAISAALATEEPT